MREGKALRRSLHRVLLGCAGGLVLACFGSGEAPRPGEAPSDWARAQAELAALGPGFVVWESNRSGAWRIWLRALDGSGLRMLSPDEPGHDHFSAHVAPDGTRVVYLSYPRPWSSYREPPPDAPSAQLVLLELESGETRVLADARSYGESRSAVWIDAHSLVYLDRAGDTRRLELETGADERLAGNGPGGPFLLSPTLTHGTSNAPSFSIYRPERRDLLRQPFRDGCQPYFTRDGRFGYWTSRAGGPIQRMELSSETMSTVLERGDDRLPEPFTYVYFPMVSPGQRLLAFGASRGEHDHFRADYEIFLAAIDPRSLELEGRPVRYTFDPATDRFPDVFVGGLEMGHHEGEAPHPISLDPSSVRLDFPRGAVLSWDYGDGSQGRSVIGRHVYETAGRYTVSARLETGEGVLTTAASIDVDPPQAPEPLRSFQRGDELLVDFDEPIDASVAELRFDSGARVVETFVGPGGHTLHIRVDRRLQAGEILEMTGVRDQGAIQRVMMTQRIPVEPSTWPMDPGGLVFSVDPEAGARWRDPARRSMAPAPLEGLGRARRDRNGALLVTGGSFTATEEVARAIGEACRGDAFTVEALLAPLRNRQGKDARVMSLEHEERVYLGLTQDGSRLRLRIRTNDDKVLGIGVFESAEPTHFVASYGGGQLSSYRNGRKVQDTDRIQGKVDWRDASRLELGAGAKGRDWRGRIERFALYCRAMGEAEVANNAHAALQQLTERAPIATVAVRARLREISEVPSLDAILPYRDGLFTASWEVLEVLSGELGAPEVRVAHWAFVNGEAQQAAGLEPGFQTVLRLEPFEQQPQVQALYVSDTLDFDPTLPIFLDVRP